MNLARLFRVKKGTDLYEILFRVGVWFKIIDGSLKIVLGLSLLRLIGLPISQVFLNIMRHELTEDPHDLFIHKVGPLLSHKPLTVSYFLASYFLFWGVIDIVLSINLLKKKLWVFPVSLGLITIFTLYELYRFTHTHSIILVYLIIIDIGLLWIIQKEYKKLKRRLVHRAISPVSE